MTMTPATVGRAEAGTSATTRTRRRRRSVMTQGGEASAVVPLVGVRSAVAMEWTRERGVTGGGMVVGVLTGKRTRRMMMLKRKAIIGMAAAVSWIGATTEKAGLSIATIVPALTLRSVSKRKAVLSMTMANLVVTLRGVVQLDQAIAQGRDQAWRRRMGG